MPTTHVGEPGVGSQCGLLTTAVRASAEGSRNPGACTDFPDTIWAVTPAGGSYPLSSAYEMEMPLKHSQVLTLFLT